MAFVPRTSAAYALLSRRVAACAPAGRPSARAGLALAPTLLLGRTMCAGEQGSVEDRVIKAVKGYVEMRKGDLMDETIKCSGNRESMLEALSQKVTVATKWDDLGFDDLDRVEVLLEVEDEFEHVIPDDISEKISSVQESVEYLTKRLGL
mmetsp:Transcript_37443/g.87025  ORF Transcript_37443/g.87025 Transcript_37443/m.87025 type:complete len:150 (-) Transcript_37443:54-503(-)